MVGQLVGDQAVTELRCPVTDVERSVDQVRVIPIMLRDRPFPPPIKRLGEEAGTRQMSLTAMPSAANSRRSEDRSFCSGRPTYGHTSRDLPTEARMTDTPVS
jgi:hypothetical protein